MGCLCLPLCFPSSATVLTSKSGLKNIPELYPFEEILTVKLKQSKGGITRYTKFYTYLHYDPDTIAEFVSIHCGIEELLISSQHLVFLQNGRTVPAGNVKVGDILLNVRSEDGIPAVVPTAVTALDTKVFKGIYAPLTSSGTLVVNGFLVSSYAHVKSHAVAHAAMAPLRVWFQQREILQKGKTENFPNHKKILGFANVLLRACSALPPSLSKKLITVDSSSD